MICKESYSFPLYYLAKRLKKENKIAAFFILPGETSIKECIYNKYTYYNFLREDDIDIYTCNEIAKEFTENINNPNICDEEIGKIEKNYTHFKNLNVQLISSQLFSTAYHGRTYIKASTYRQQLYWLYLNYKNAERIIEDFCPDLILDTDIAELGRTVLHEVAYKKSVPYISIGFSRFEQFKYPSLVQVLDSDEYFREVYSDIYENTDNDLTDEIEYIEKFRSRTCIMSSEYKGTATSRYHADSIINVLKRLVKSIYIAFDAELLKGKNYRFRKKNNILYANHFEVVRFGLRCELKRRWLYKKNKYFEIPVMNERYFYMPLHLIPESSTFVGAPFYINELSIIEAISKALPANCYLYVKEHQSMLGERTLEFYKKIRKIPNVRLMQLNYYEDPKPWIANSEGVITITGTGAYEAAMLGKPAYVFGDVMYNVIEGITRVKSFEELPYLLKGNCASLSNIQSCAAYIHTVKKLGREVNLLTLLYEGNKCLIRGKEPSENFYNYLENLELLYEDGYRRYCEGYKE